MKTKFYTLALFQRIQGQTIRICAVQTEFFSTRKRDAEREARRYAKARGYTDADKFVGVETL